MYLYVGTLGPFFGRKPLQSLDNIISVMKVNIYLKAYLHNLTFPLQTRLQNL